MFYKYTSHISFLSNTEVKFSLVECFNDPYEINPSKNPKKITLIAKKSYENYSAEKTRDTFGKIFTEKEISEIENKFFELESNSKINGIYDQFLDKLRGEIFIFCLSKNSTNPLMWAHYADKHKGLCIGFDSNHSFFNENSFEVEYSNHRFAPTCAEPEHLMGIVYRKSLDWSYEEEIRVIKTKDQMNIDKNPKSLIKIPKDAIKEILIGILSTEETKQKCLKFSKKMNIPCYQIKESIDSFEFERELIFTPHSTR